jgi:hypothetical protein
VGDHLAGKRLKRPRDPISLAKLIGDITTGQLEDKTDDGKSAVAAVVSERAATPAEAAYRLSGGFHPS